MGEKKTNGTKFKIETGVPVPTSPRKAVGSEYPIDELKPNQSFFVAVEDPEKFVFISQRLRSISHAYGSRHSCTFAVRKVDGGIRVWRTS